MPRPTTTVRHLSRASEIRPIVAENAPSATSGRHRRRVRVRGGRTRCSLQRLLRSSPVDKVLGAPGSESAASGTGERRDTGRAIRVAHVARGRALSTEHASERLTLRDNGRVTVNPTSTELPGWRHVYSGKVRDLYVPAETPDGAQPGAHARRRERPRQRVRPRALARHPGQGRAAHHPQPVVVRPARGRRRRPRHPEPSRRVAHPHARRRRRGEHRRRPAEPDSGCRHRARDGREESRHAADRVRRARLPDGVGLGRVPRERHGVRHRAPRRARRTATGCPSRSTPPPSRRRWASTTRTSRTSAPSSSSAPSARPSCATCRSRSTPAPQRRPRRTA